MNQIDAHNAMLTIDLVRKALRYIDGAPECMIVRMHPAQEAEWENLGVMVTSIDYDRLSRVVYDVSKQTFESESEGLVNFPHRTFGGRRIVEDPWFSVNRIHFEVDYKPVFAIVNLAVPAHATIERKES